MSRLTFSRQNDGTFNLAESKLVALVDALFDGNQEPRVPASLMSAATRELVSATHRLAGTRNIDFSRAAGIVIRERPALFRLTRCEATHDGDANADVALA